MKSDTNSQAAPPVEVGQLREQRVLDTTATYRIVDVAGDHVEVEAIDVPGLEPGHRVRLTADAVEAMVVLGDEPRAVRMPASAELPRMGPKTA